MDKNLTEKSRAAITEAQGQALDRNHNTLEPEHLLHALLSDAEGLVPTILRRLGKEPAALKARAERALDALPVGSADAEIRAGSRFARAMREAGRAMEALGDQYVSVEHLLVALMVDGGEAGKILAETGLRVEDVERVVSEVRAGRSVDNENPEATYDALEKYGRDLTAAAAEGKLDPVIGRDEEIRRVIARQEEVGLKAVTDGEFRRSWWHLDFLWGLDGANKLDMGKSCVRFKNLEKIPYSLIGELMQQRSVGDWISRYEEVRPK